MKTAKPKKFLSIEKNAKNAPVKDLVWEGEEVSAVSEKYKIEDDKGTGQAVVIRFFDFGANPQSFKDHKPTAQELFDNHRRGLEALLWRDGLKPYEGVEPRFMFSKDKSHYRFIITCVPRNLSGMTQGTPQTLSELLK